MRSPTKIVQELIRIPSVNPMGKTLADDIIYEHRITGYLLEFFDRLGLERQELPVERVGGITRSNVVGVLRGRPDPQIATTIMLQAHQDTVPIDGMTVDPFGGEVRDGRIYGRGACDIKGALGTVLSVVERLVHNPPEQHPTLMFAFTINEECGFTGATALMKALKSGPLLGCRLPEAIIVSEPTSLNVVTGHKGMIRWRCHTHGIAGHSSAPDEGVNAIYAMSAVVQHLCEFQSQHLTKRPVDPLLGRPTLSVGTIQGGISVNTIPDRCAIEIDRRTLPNEDPAAARQEIIDHMERVALKGATLTHEEPFMSSTGLMATNNGALANQICDVVRKHVAACQAVGAAYGTDAAALSQSGVPTVVFGPGHIAQAHTKDEWVEVSQLQTAEQILWEFVTGFQLRS